MQGFFCFFIVAIFTVLAGRRTKPVLQPREEGRTMVQVPIHERGAQDKPLEKLFHIIFYRHHPHKLSLPVWESYGRQERGQYE